MLESHWLDIPIKDLSRSLKRSILVVFGASLYETMNKTPSSLVKKKRGGKILNNYLLILSIAMIFCFFHPWPFDSPNGGDIFAPEKVTNKTPPKKVTRKDLDKDPYTGICWKGGTKWCYQFLVSSPPPKTVTCINYLLRDKKKPRAWSALPRVQQRLFHSLLAVECVDTQNLGFI